MAACVMWVEWAEVSIISGTMHQLSWQSIILDILDCTMFVLLSESVKGKINTQKNVKKVNERGSLPGSVRKTAWYLYDVWRLNLIITKTPFAFQSNMLANRQWRSLYASWLKIFHIVKVLYCIVWDPCREPCRPGLWMTCDKQNQK